MTGAQGEQPRMSRLMAHACALLSEYPVADGHNDLAWALREQVDYDLAERDISTEQRGFLHTDLPRLRAGGVGAQFWSVYVSTDLTGDQAVSAVLEQVDCVRALIRTYPDTLVAAETAADLEHTRAHGTIASLMGAEGGHCLNESLGTLRMLRALGVRYLTLTHNDNVRWADSATDTPATGGLSRFGAEVVREMNRIGMLVDLSHVAADTMRHALEVTRAPVLFSHSCARALCDHPRNVPDDVLAALPKNGGVAMATFVPKFVSAEFGEWERAREEYVRSLGEMPESESWSTLPAWREFTEQNPPPRVDVSTVADHVEHLRDVAGVDHIGLGGDYDGTGAMPEGLEDVSGYPRLIAELLRRGWSEDDLAKLVWHNVVRVLRNTDRIAADLSAQEAPSTARLVDLDG